MDIIFKCSIEEAKESFIGYEWEGKPLILTDNEALQYISFIEEYFIDELYQATKSFVLEVLRQGED